MPSFSSANLLELAAGDDSDFAASPRRPPILPRLMADAAATGIDDAPASPMHRERRIIVTHRLPLRAAPDPSAACGFAFSWDHDAVALQLRSGLPPTAEVMHVGTLATPVDPAQHAAVSWILYDRFRCLPVFIPADLHRRFYHGFCKHYLWPLFHYLLPLSPSSLGGLPFDRSLWLSYLSANKLFADRLIELLNPDDDLVWIHDYHLLALPTFLRRRSPRVKLGFFLHSPFPSSEIFRTIPVREELLRALLNADLVGFHTFDYARHFLSSCSRLLGLDYQSKRGYIGIEYYGRTVTVKILPVGIDMGQHEFVISSPETTAKVQELQAKYKDKILMLGVDDVDLFKGIGMKLLAVEQLLEEHPRLRGRAVMVQIANPARSEGKDVQEVRDEVESISKRINERFGRPGYEPIVMINRTVQTYEKAAFYAVAECCVVNPVRDGMNLVPYQYTVCRQQSPALAEASKKSIIVVSEFVGCSPSLSGAIRVNPWNVNAVAEAINLAITMPETEKQLRHEKHYKYVSSHDVAYWAKSFDLDLQRACKDHFHRRCWGIGFGMSFRVVALAPSFRKLSVEHIASAYQKTNSRLILLDYDGTMMPQSSIDKKPSSEVISVLNGLCSDPKNVVFLVSGRGKDELGKWFAQCEKLGISAEHGYFTRWSKDAPWESCMLAADFDWKKIAEPVMRLYMEATDGSSIEPKESGLVWHHQAGEDGSDVDLGKAGGLFSPRGEAAACGGGGQLSGQGNAGKDAAGKAAGQERKVASQGSVENDRAMAPAAKAQVVGWPPIRNYRKNTMTTNPSKNKDDDGKQGLGCLYVKVSMDGAPYLRKVDLKIYKNYKELSSALEKMFSCFTIGQCGSHGIPGKDGLSESHLMDLLNGSEYVLTYEDKDGDWMLVGDVPWEMFTDSCRRLRIMKGSDAIGLAPRAMEKCKNRN